MRIELILSRSQQDVQATTLRAPLFGATEEIRTPDPLVRSQILYPTELRSHRMAEGSGIEPLITSSKPAVIPFN